MKLSSFRRLSAPSAPNQCNKLFTKQGSSPMHASAQRHLQCYCWSTTSNKAPASNQSTLWRSRAPTSKLLGREVMLNGCSTNFPPSRRMISRTCVSGSSSPLEAAGSCTLYSNHEAVKRNTFLLNSLQWHSACACFRFC